MKVIDDATITAVATDTEYIASNFDRFNEVLLVIDYTKGGEDSMDIFTAFSSSELTDDSDLFASDFDEVEDSGPPVRTLLSEKIRNLSASGIYRLRISKSIIEDKMRLQFAAVGGSGPFGQVTAYLETESVKPS